MPTDPDPTMIPQGHVGAVPPKAKVPGGYDVTSTTPVPTENRDEEAKATERLDPAQLHGQDPEEVARRMGTTGADLGFAKD